jgi:hypothetical protein
MTRDYDEYTEALEQEIARLKDKTARYEEVLTAIAENKAMNWLAMYPQYTSWNFPEDIPCQIAGIILQDIDKPDSRIKFK